MFGKCKVQSAKLKVSFYLLSTLSFALCTSTALAQTVTAIDIEQEGEPVSDPLILGLVQTRAGAPLSIADVRESITHLISLTQYEDVQVYEDPAAGGVRLRYVLFPVHAVDRLEFRGTLGIAEDTLRRAVVERFGQAPDSIAFRFVDIKLGDICRIEIAHVRSRSSEISFVLSVPRFSEPSMREYPLRSLRAANKLTVGVFSIGMIRATFLPRSVTVIPPNFSLFRTHSPVFSCNSRIEIDFMCHTVTH